MTFNIIVIISSNLSSPTIYFLHLSPMSIFPLRLLVRLRGGVRCLRVSLMILCVFVCVMVRGGECERKETTGNMLHIPNLISHENLTKESFVVKFKDAGPQHPFLFITTQSSLIYISNKILHLYMNIS